MVGAQLSGALLLGACAFALGVVAGASIVVVWFTRK